jgi:hypothetical protein
MTSRAEGLGRAWIGGGLAAVAGGGGTADTGFAIAVAPGIKGRPTVGLRDADTSDCAGVRAQPELSAVKTMAAIKRITGTTPPTPFNNLQC